MTLLQILDEEVELRARQLDEAKRIVREYQEKGAFSTYGAPRVKWTILAEHPHLSVADVTIAIDIATRPPKN